MGRPLFSFSYSTAPAVRTEPEPSAHPCEKWTHWNPFDPDSDEFFESPHAVYEAFIDPTVSASVSSASSDPQQQQQRRLDMDREGSQSVLSLSSTSSSSSDTGSSDMGSPVAAGTDDHLTHLAQAYIAMNELSRDQQPPSEAPTTASETTQVSYTHWLPSLRSARIDPPDQLAQADFAMDEPVRDQQPLSQALPVPTTASGTSLVPYTRRLPQLRTATFDLPDRRTFPGPRSASSASQGRRTFSTITPINVPLSYRFPSVEPPLDSPPPFIPPIAPTTPVEVYHHYALPSPTSPPSPSSPSTATYIHWPPELLSGGSPLPNRGARVSLTHITSQVISVPDVTT